MIAQDKVHSLIVTGRGDINPSDINEQQSFRMITKTI